MYVSGPAYGVNRPSPGSSAGARNASDEGSSSFSSSINHGMVDHSDDVVNTEQDNTSGIRQPSLTLSYNVGGSLMLVWVWNILVTYHDVPDLHIHERTHQEFAHACLGLYVCMF